MGARSSASAARETEVQSAVRSIYEALGCIVYTLADYRTGYKRVSRGVPDLLVFCERKRLAFFQEVKTDDGKQSPEQREFQRRCQRTRMEYVLGGVQAAYDTASRLGLAPPGKSLYDALHPASAEAEAPAP